MGRTGARVGVYAYAIAFALFGAQRGSAAQESTDASARRARLRLETAQDLLAALPGLRSAILTTQHDTGSRKRSSAHSCVLGALFLREHAQQAWSRAKRVTLPRGRATATLEFRDTGGAKSQSLLFVAEDGSLVLGRRSWSEGLRLDRGASAGLRARLQALRTQPGVARRTTMLVTSLAELLAAARPHRRLLWRGPSPLVIPASPDDSLQRHPDRNPHAFLDKHGVLVLRGLQNFELRSDDTQALTVHARTQREVLRFENCRAIHFENFILGHDPKVGRGCIGPVVTARDCEGLRMRDCGFFGCGSRALELTRCARVRVELCELYECNIGVLSLDACCDVRFASCRIRDCSVHFDGAIHVEGCRDVRFEDCSIARVRDGSMRLAIFEVGGAEAIVFRGGSITDCEARALRHFDPSVRLEKTTLAQNRFRR